MSGLAPAICLLCLCSPSLAQEARGGKQIVESVCVKCHGTGVNGAPKIGDRDAWIPRLAKGLEELQKRAIRGHDGMPSRGGRADLTDAEMRSAIVYMFNTESANARPVTAKAAAKRPGLDEMVVDGIKIHFGLKSAGELRGYLANSAEAKMHGGVPSGADNFHVNVSLFDAASGTPIRNAEVEARLEQPGTAGETRALEPMAFQGASSYGNYFHIAPHTPYAFTVRVKKAGYGSVTTAQFRPHSDKE
jgi:cytochrome c5